MAYKEISDTIKYKYTNALANDQDIRRFFAKLRYGSAQFPDVLKMSTKAADILTSVFGAEFQAEFPTGIPPDALLAILPNDLRKCCADVLDASRSVITSKNQNADIGIQGLELEPDADRINNLAKHLSESLTDEGMLPAETRGLVRNLVNSETDRAIKENVRFLERAGVNATVSREYTGSGLKDGPCEWCMARVGTHVPVSEAISMGMFERHEGCGCTIDYETEKGTKRQVDWTHNKWADTEETLEKRKIIGL